MVSSNEVIGVVLGHGLATDYMVSLCNSHTTQCPETQSLKESDSIHGEILSPESISHIPEYFNLS